MSSMLNSKTFFVRYRLSSDSPKRLVVRYESIVLKKSPMAAGGGNDT